MRVKTKSLCLCACVGGGVSVDVGVSVGVGVCVCVLLISPPVCILYTNGRSMYIHVMYAVGRQRVLDRETFGTCSTLRRKVGGLRGGGGVVLALVVLHPTIRSHDNSSDIYFAVCA